MVHCTLNSFKLGWKLSVSYVLQISNNLVIPAMCNPLASWTCIMTQSSTAHAKRFEISFLYQQQRVAKKLQMYILAYPWKRSPIRPETHLVLVSINQFKMFRIGSMNTRGKQNFSNSVNSSAALQNLWLYFPKLKYLKIIGTAIAAPFDKFFSFSDRNVDGGLVAGCSTIYSFSYGSSND